MSSRSAESTEYDLEEDLLTEEHENNRRLKVQIREKDLLCVNGCGFYGTPQWGNRCSKCWRAHQIVEKRNLDFAKNRTLLSFDNFQERRKIATESRSLTLKKIFKSPSMLGSSSSDSLNSAAQRSSPVKSTPVRSRQLSPDSRLAREGLSLWLTVNLPSSIVQDITRHTKHAVNRINEIRCPPDELSEQVQTFYQDLSDKMNHNSHFSQCPNDMKVQDMMEEIEKYICVCCYSQLFCASSDEEVADLSLQDRIRSLHWVTSGFLETKLDFTRQAVRDKLDDAISEMIDMNSHRRADEKLECLVRCCHRAFESLNESGAPTSADEFLPVLIYILLKGNPPLIQSNVKFISRFALPSRVMSGESGYFFTNLSCAMQFVQDMNHDSLKMDRTEFEAYTSGDLVPPLSMINCGCNHAIGSMEKSLNRVRQLIERQQALSSRIEAIDRRISSEESTMCEDFEKLMSDYPSNDYKSLKLKLEAEESLTMGARSLSSTGTSSRSSRETEEDETSPQIDESVDTGL